MDRVIGSVLMLVFMMVMVLALIPWFVDSVDIAVRQSENFPILSVLLLIPNPVEEVILRIITVGLSIFGVVKIWL